MVLELKAEFKEKWGEVGGALKYQESSKTSKMNLFKGLINFRIWLPFF